MPPNGQNKNDSDQYIKDFKEWQEHQYNPYHWTGNKTPPFIKYGGKKLGIVYLIIGVLIISLGTFSIFTNQGSGSDRIISLAVYSIFGILAILVGLKKIRFG